MTSTDLGGLGGFSMSSSLINDVGAYLGEFAGDYDVDGLVNAYRAAINGKLHGTGITMHGDEFYGTVPVPENHAELIKDAIDAVEFNPLAEKFDTADQRTPKPTTMPTGKVAAYLGITRGSVSNVLTRKGVRPIPGERSAAGENLYDQAAIEAFKRGEYPALPAVPAEVDERVDLDAFTPGWFHQAVQVDVREYHPALPIFVDRNGHKMRPQIVDAQFLHDQPGLGWKVSLTLHGVRVRLNGNEGAAWSTSFYTLDDVREKGPAWLVDWVITRTPALPTPVTPNPKAA